MEFLSSHIVLELDHNKFCSLFQRTLNGFTKNEGLKRSLQSTDPFDVPMTDSVRGNFLVPLWFLHHSIQRYCFLFTMPLNIKEIPLTCSLCSYIDFCISIDVPFLLQATLRILKMK